MVARCLHFLAWSLGANESWPALSSWLAATWLLAEEKPQIPLDKLDGATKAKVLAALAGLVILWFALILFIWWGARITRRYMKSQFDKAPESKPVNIDRDDWARKPLVASGEDEEDDV